MMVRIIGTRIIIPKGDTGSFSLPRQETNTNYAKFIVQDPLTLENVIEKEITLVDNYFVVDLTSEDTRELPAKKYFWDIKSYYEPSFDEDGILVDALEIHSYYSAFKHPLFIIKEVIKDV